MLLDNYFQELLDLLKEFRDLLDDETVTAIATALGKIADLIPAAGSLFTELKSILVTVQTVIKEFDITAFALEGIDADEFFSLVKKIETLIQKTTPLLPASAAGTAADAQNVAGTVASLPELTSELRDEIVAVIGDILDKLP